MPAPDPAQYDSFAAEYEEHASVAPYNPPYNPLYDRLVTLQLVGDVKGKRVLDAACCPGIYAEDSVRCRRPICSHRRFSASSLEPTDSDLGSASVSIKPRVRR